MRMIIILTLLGILNAEDICPDYLNRDGYGAGDKCTAEHGCCYFGDGDCKDCGDTCWEGHGERFDWINGNSSEDACEAVTGCCYEAATDGCGICVGSTVTEDPCSNYANREGTNHGQRCTAMGGCCFNEDGSCSDCEGKCWEGHGVRPGNSKDSCEALEGCCYQASDDGCIPCQGISPVENCVRVFGLNVQSRFNQKYYWDGSEEQHGMPVYRSNCSNELVAFSQYNSWWIDDDLNDLQGVNGDGVWGWCEGTNVYNCNNVHEWNGSNWEHQPQMMITECYTRRLEKETVKRADVDELEYDIKRLEKETVKMNYVDGLEFDIPAPETATIV